MQPFYDHDGITLYRGDCLEVMPYLISQGITVEATICDPPYGSTACSWDTVIPFVDMWRNIKALNKPKAATVLFGSEPFSSTLRMSNFDWFRYDWIWHKPKPTGIFNAEYRPLKAHEIISVFSDAKTKSNQFTDDRMNYNPQGVKRVDRIVPQKTATSAINTLRGLSGDTYTREYENYPRSVIPFGLDAGSKHPTQKPVALMQYLIRTYTNPGDTVLDFTCGSGTTLLAAKLEGRKCIGIERDTGKDGECLGYCSYAVERLAQSCMVFV